MSQFGLPSVHVEQKDKILLEGSVGISIFIYGKQFSLTGFGYQKGLDNISSVYAGSIEIKKSFKQI